MELTLACAAWRFWSFAFRTISGDGSRELARELLPLAGLRATAEEDSVMDADIEVGVCHLLDRSREFLSPPRILVYVRSGGLGPRHETGGSLNIVFEPGGENGGFRGNPSWGFGDTFSSV